jgi:hypothetical protein
VTAEPSTQLSRALAGRCDISREIGRGGIRICCRCSIRVKRTVSSSTVMPFVEGESLRARLDREKQLPVDEAVRIASAVAAALDYADSNGVIRGSAFAMRSWTSSAEFNAPGRGESAPGMRAHHALARDRWGRGITNRCS